MFNNAVFSELTIHGMTKPPEMMPSMRRLYDAAGSRDINSPSAVARVLVTTQQRLKNWEKRGISKEGAMKAQAIFGLDSNELRALDAKAVDIAAYRDRHAPYVAPMAGEERKPYPVQRPSRDHWTTEAIAIMKGLKPAQREGAVATLRTYVDNLGRTPKHNPPAPEFETARAV